MATLVVVLLLIGYWGVLFYATHTPLPVGLLPGQTDKAIHFTAYGLLAVLMMTLRATRGAFGWYSVVMRWFVLAAYGAFDELTQLLVNRSCDFVDWLSDVAGVTCGLLAVAFICWQYRKSQVTSETHPA
ncbi:VanZ family protein [Schlesneria paludicola]|uniref:VanZ family protein n=1 Tax=Schlesneria paludicola TaxID=360056 RepID=UPI0002E8881F|nr:VanZ family protein [Schlesneria paludicola]